MPDRLEPNQRLRRAFTPEEWEAAVRLRPFAYQEIRRFVSHITKRSVLYRGRIGETNFRWIVEGGSWLGIDPAALCQDLEYRALEAVALAHQDFRKDGEHDDYPSKPYLRKVIQRELKKEYDRWRLTSTSIGVHSYGDANDPYFGKDQEEPSYLMNFDQDESDDGLSDEDRERLQAALGVLSSKEAWALRMIADGSPMDVVADRLGYKNVQAAYKLVATAREKGQKANEARK